MARYTSLVQFPRFETTNDALSENYVRIAILRKVGGSTYDDLAQRLLDCSENTKACNSLACKLCNRKFRVQKVDYLVNKIRDERQAQRKTRWWAVTIIDYSHSFTDKELDSFDVQKSKDRLRKLLERSGFESPIVGSFEVDFHESCGLWLPHYHLLCRRTRQNKRAKEVFNEKITKQNPLHIKQGRSPKPVKFQKVSCLFTQISYMYKLVSLCVYDHEYKVAGRVKTKTSKKRLSEAMFCRSLSWLDRIGRRRVLFSFGEREWR